MQQLKATIARDLVQGQGEHSPTKELLKQYVPLEGIITTPAPDGSSRPTRTEHHQLQPVSDPRTVREGRLLPALFVVARLPSGHLHRRLFEAGQIGPYVEEKASGDNRLLGKARTN